MDKAKISGATASSKSDVKSIERINSKITVVSARNETNKMCNSKSEYAGARHKVTKRANPVPEVHSYLFKLMHNELVMELLQCASGEENLVLNRCLRPSAHTLWYEIIVKVKSDLFNALAAKYPAIQFEVYGSTLMGIAFKDSNLDFHIELFPEPNADSAIEVIDEATKLLRRSSNFSKLTPFMNSRSPLLNCLHLKTGYFCHLNFYDRFGVHNGPILAHLLTFDARIDFLASVIKYWMKVHFCSGTRRMSNYAVLWMLLFYLQSIPSPIVPPIAEFQMNVRNVMVEDFNFAFDYNYPNNTRNQQRCSRLLLGFFQFYDGFDFESQVISPLHGRAFARSDVKASKLAEFARYDAILNQRERYKRPLYMKSPICIQDPFEITNSISVRLCTKQFESLTAKISFAANLVEQELLQHGESTNLFLKLFDANLFDANLFGNNADRNLPKHN